MEGFRYLHSFLRINRMGAMDAYTTPPSYIFNRHISVKSIKYTSVRSAFFTRHRAAIFFFSASTSASVSHFVGQSITRLLIDRPEPSMLKTRQRENLYISQPFFRFFNFPGDHIPRPLYNRVTAPTSRGHQVHLSA